MFATHQHPYPQSSVSPKGSAGTISELNPEAQLYLLRTLIRVKQPWPDPPNTLHPVMNALTEELFCTSSDPDPRSCLFESLGIFFIQILDVLSQLSISLTNGPHIAAYTHQYFNSIGFENDFSDLSVVSSYLDKRTSMLGDISSELGELSNRLERVWSERPVPKREWKLPLHPQPSFHTPNTANTFLNLAYPAPYNTNLLPQTMSNNQYSDPNALLARGKGKHTCHYGVACDKGGINDDGSLVIFERNSSFRAHMAKHEKKYKCDLPGCPNTMGFARPDQLQRHQQTVKHRI